MAATAVSSCRPLLMAAILALVGASPAAAQLPGPPEGGFSGFVTVLTGYVSGKSQFSTDGENRETSSLNSSGQTVDSFVVAPLFELAYAVADWRTQVYVGLPIENIREGTFFQQEVGVRHWLEDGTRLTAAFLPWPVIAQKTWQDPFVTGEGRERTDVDALGFKLDADRIARTNFGLRYRFVHRSIDDEDSGAFLRDLPGSTLTEGDVRDLRRDADTHQGTLSYARPIGRGLLLRPALRLHLRRRRGQRQQLPCRPPRARGPVPYPRLRREREPVLRAELVQRGQSDLRREARRQRLRRRCPLWLPRAVRGAQRPR